MTTRAAVWAAVAVAVVPAVGGGQPPAPAKAKIEFRWMEPRPVAGITEEAGIQTSCGPGLWYPHKTPVLTNADIAAATLTATDFNTAAGKTELFTVTFHPTEAARRKVAAAFGDAKQRDLAVYIDGRYWGTRVLGKATLAEPFTMWAGFTSSRADAERWVAACK